MRAPSSGELRDRVVFERATTAQDSTGDPVETWTTLATRSARVEWDGGVERFEGQRDRADTGCVVTIRFGLALTAKDRMIVDGLTCDIENTPYDLNGRRKWLVVKGVHRG